MKGINYNFLSAFNHACYAAYAFIIIDNCMIIYDMYSAFRTRSFAFSAGDAPETAGFSDNLIIFFCGRARNEVGGILRNHVDQMLWAYAFGRTVAAAVAFISVDYNFSVFELHGALFANFNAISNTAAAAFTFAALEACFN